MTTRPIDRLHALRDELLDLTKGRTADGKPTHIPPPKTAAGQAKARAAGYAPIPGGKTWAHNSVRRRSHGSEAEMPARKKFGGTPRGGRVPLPPLNPQQVTQVQARGGSWDAEQRRWTVAEEDEADVRAMLRGSVRRRRGTKSSGEPPTTPATPSRVTRPPRPEPTPPTTWTPATRQARVQAIQAQMTALQAELREHQSTLLSDDEANRMVIETAERIDMQWRSGAPVLVDQLRKRIPSQVDKETFDRHILRMVQDGTLVLHGTDRALSMSPEKRDELVTDGQNNYYTAVSLRRHR